MRLAELEAANRRMLEHAPSVRPVPTGDIIRTHRKKHPFRGWVEIDSPHCEPFVMFCGNDEAVALDTLWNGRFGYEPGSLATWARLAAGASTIADVGAHVGYFTLIAALANPRAAVHAFEPVDFIHARLAVNQRGNAIKNITRHQAGVSDRQGWADIGVRFSANLLSTGSSLEPAVAGQARTETKRIPLRTIDAVFGDSGVDLIKIDVEGHEPHVLAGARQTLRRHRPTVLLEELRDTPPDALLAPFSPFGYDAHWISEADGSPVPFTAPRPAGSRNVLFTPRR
jgi:FkbM family methyltransferase